MQYTESVLECLKGKAQQYAEGIDWQKACEQVNDPRRTQGQRFRLTSILLLALAAMLSNHLSELAIAQWGAGQSEEVKRALGFENGVTPHQSTIQRLFRRLNVEEVEAAFRGITLSFLQPAQTARGNCGVAIDGKAQRGRLPFEEQQSYPIHAVSLLDHQTGIVLTQGHVQASDVQAPVEEKQLATKKALSDEEEQEEKKARSELAVAARLLPLIDWRGKVLTGDALYCQRTLCSALREAGGDYLFLVKGNQPRLLEDLHLLFAPVPAPTRKGEGILRLPEQEAHTTQKGHGRVELRSIRVSGELKDYSDWPGLEQVFEIRRRFQSKGVCKEAIRYGVTSLPAVIALPEALLTFKRGHWSIENALHYVRDASMGEDKSTVHCDNGPKIMSACRNMVISLLRHAGFSTIAARLRYNSGHPQAALAVLSLSG